MSRVRSRRPSPRSGRLSPSLGVGLIGGSIAAARPAAVDSPNALSASAETESRLAGTRQRRTDRRGIDRLRRSAADADLAVVCTPVDRIAARCPRPGRGDCPRVAADRCGQHQAAAVRRTCRPGRSRGPAFIGSHPLAGSTRQGFEHADADLFDRKICVVTPQPTANPSDTARLDDFWTALGAVVIHRTPDEHDRALACTSHLPHLIAAALAGFAVRRGHRTVAASGFRDTTRIASGDPALWVPILPTQLDGRRNRAGPVPGPARRILRRTRTRRRRAPCKSCSKRPKESATDWVEPGGAPDPPSRPTPTRPGMACSGKSKSDPRPTGNRSRGGPSDLGRP